MKFIFDNDLFLIRRTRVSDLGLSALGTGLKELKSLTILSLNFKYFKFILVRHFLKRLSGECLFITPRVSESHCVLNMNSKIGVFRLTTNAKVMFDNDFF